jgi:predicted PurR-regulated permease PerM
MSSAGFKHSESFESALEISLRLGLVALLLAWCFLIVLPFINLMIWGAVMAIALQPVLLKLTKALGGRPKTALAIIVLVGLAVVLVPVLLISESLVTSATGLAGDVEQGTLVVPPPPPKVADLPLVGNRVHGAWKTASQNLQTFVSEHREQMREMTARVLSALASAGGSVLQFLVSLLVTAAFLANTETISAGFKRLASRLIGTQSGGDEFLALSTSTVRTVVTGVLGVAAIQGVLAGLGALLFGVPAAGVIAVLVLIVAIAQLPPLLVLLPAVIWVFGTTDSQIVAWGFLIYCILVNLSDVVLKPLLLGRGSSVPMLVVLLGAIGGMVLNGIIGLFVGAVVLSLGYRLFVAWLETDEPDAEPADAG